MKKVRFLVAGLMLLAGTSAALAAEKAWVVVDTVKNCSVIIGNPSEGMTPIGNKDGYASKDEAVKALAEVRDNAETCAGVVE